jgi:hypothetical protein
LKDDSVYLRHILECIRRIEEDGAAGSEAFLASHTLQDAILNVLARLAVPADPAAFLALVATRFKPVVI